MFIYKLQYKLYVLGSIVQHSKEVLPRHFGAQFHTSTEGHLRSIVDEHNDGAA